MWRQVGLSNNIANKTSGGDGIPVELFQILKDDAVKVLQSTCQQIWKSSGHRTGKGQFSFQSQRKEMPNNTQFFAFISHTSNVMLKILQARLQQYLNHELPDVQAGFRKGRGTKIKLPTSAGSSGKQESSRRTSISALLTMPKLLTVWIIINCGKFWRRWEYQTTWPASWETCIRSGSNS